MKTVQIAPVRTLIDIALKDILLETNIVFTQGICGFSAGNTVIPAGIRVINMDKSHTIRAHLFSRCFEIRAFLL